MADRDLQMRGAVVHTLRELRLECDMDELLGHLASGRLEVWLRAIGYAKHAQKVAALSQEDPAAEARLRKILGIKVPKSAPEPPARPTRVVRLPGEPVDIEAELAARGLFIGEDHKLVVDEEGEKSLMDLIGSLSVDDLLAIRGKYDVARTQEEVVRALEDGCRSVCLDGDFFVIPKGHPNILYVPTGPNSETVVRIEGSQLDRGVAYWGFNLDWEYHWDGLMQADGSRLDARKYVRMNGAQPLNAAWTLGKKTLNEDKALNDPRLLTLMGETGEELAAYGQDRAMRIPNQLEQAAEKMYGPALVLMGRSLEGEGPLVLKPDVEQAAKCYRAAAMAGDPQGMYLLGCACARGRGVARNDEEAAKWLGRSASQGFRWAQYALARMILDGRVPGAGPDDADLRMRQAALRGVPAAAKHVADSMRDVNPDEAARWDALLRGLVAETDMFSDEEWPGLSKAARLGQEEPGGRSRRGRRGARQDHGGRGGRKDFGADPVADLEDGTPVARDEDELADLVAGGARRVALAGGPFLIPRAESIHYVGLGDEPPLVRLPEEGAPAGVSMENLRLDFGFYRDDLLTPQAERLDPERYLAMFSGNRELAVTLLKAEMGADPWVLLLAASCFFRLGDENLGLQCARPAASKEHAPAHLWLGMAQQRPGTEGGAKEAFGWLHKGARWGYGPAMDELAAAYWNGMGVEPSEEAAFMWWTRAARRGCPSAMTSAGLCLLEGRGTAVNREQAERWIELAMLSGDQRGLEAMKALADGSAMPEIVRPLEERRLAVLGTA